jgi:two-component system nitrate/nitrite response regulator NarL
MRLVMETQGASRSTAGSELPDLRGSRFVHPKPTVFIVSDVRLYREGLSWNLTHEGSLEVVGASGLSSITAESLEAQAPDAIIFDITMRDGLQLARALHARLPDAKIVAFAVSDIDGETVTGAMAGISGYVHRDAGIGDLVTEVLNAVRGELHCSPRLAARLLAQIASLSFGEAGANRGSATTADERRTLTQRETEILVLVERGLSNKEIARTLNISFATVKNHVHHILEKLHVHRRTQALARMRGR